MPCILSHSVLRLLRPGFPLRRSFSNRPVTHSHDSTSSIHVDEFVNPKLIRNVGVIAHIDAGKTTTTERMLYFGHRTHHIGEVDRGDTITDYLPEERERGISIISAAACLSWHHHTLHLIDTPGHVDFTMEVERSLTVVDGALTILDGTKGVQAQTRTVWHQADRYNLPRLVFVNKLDRDTANFLRSVSSLSAQLSSPMHYVPIHWPIYQSCLINQPSAIKTVPDKFIGLVDLVKMEFKNWSDCDTPDSEPASVDLFLQHGDQQPLSQETMNQIMDARTRLLGQLAEVDETLADEFLSLERPETLIPYEVIHAAVRRTTHAGLVVPILAGSSRKNIGIQPLLDAIVDYLPDPSSRPLPPAVSQLVNHRLPPTKQGTTPPYPVMLVFKIAFDRHWGPLTLVRIYSGVVKLDCMVTNLSRDQPVTEKVQSLFQLTGDYHERVQSAGVGSIVALAGLQSTHSGDLLGPDLSKYASTNDNDFHLPDSVRHDPVVYAALEPASMSVVKDMQKALDCMQREDPSLVVKLNQETGQWIVGGMGDLHLEIFQSRLQREYKVNARLGPLLIAYKECPLSSLVHSDRHESSQGFGHRVGVIDGSQRAAVALVSVEPSEQFQPQVHFDRHWFGAKEAHHEAIPRLHRLQHSIRDVCLSVLHTAGPKLRYPVVHVNVIIHRVLVGHPDSIPSSPELLEGHVASGSSVPRSYTAAAAHQALCRSAVVAALNEGIGKIGDWKLLEPMMSLEIRLPHNPDKQHDSISQFLSDLSSRRGEILSVDDSYGENESSTNYFSYRTIQALAPLSELVGYSAAVRSMSSGLADLQLTVSEYRPINTEHENRLLNQFRWLPQSS